MMQGAYQAGGSWMAPMKGWLLAQLLWDPAADPAVLRRTFLDGYYGAAGTHVGRYLERLEHAIAERPFHKDEPKVGMNLRTPPTADFLTWDVLAESWRDLARAEHAVRHDATLTQRVRATQLGPLYAILIRWDELRAKAASTGPRWPLPWSDRAQALSWWMNTTHSMGPTRLNEWNRTQNFPLMVAGRYKVRDFVGKDPLTGKKR